MKIRIIRQITDGSLTYNPGQETDVPEATAKVYIASGWAEPVTGEAASDEPTQPMRQGRPKQDD